ncbi:MAG: transaldolase [Actinobacteria bacterium RBG_13_63_9]|nr:MAG: transaldolase [Actinobacteria bacterium RBG_13_63_9]
MERNPLARLGDFGQSVWCDDISREFLQAGRLKALVEEDGVSGLTSNPTIFHKAISEGSGYDEAIRALVARKAGAEEIMEALMVEDITAAADELQPVYSATSARDGWVSIEVAPTCAYDTRKTIAEVIRVRALVERPNVLIKVPATKEGVEAARDLTGLGYSINVTLIFSLQRYREVMEAYQAGLQTLRVRRATGVPAPALSEVHGVASFFVSRVDTAVDKRLEALVGEADSSARTGRVRPAVPHDLRGKAAVANTRLAYQLFRDTFSGPRWEALQADGATVQRPLWASTSTKNPLYSDILYVQELIGPNTVNTMPLKTMDAFRDHGDPAETITSGGEQAAAHLDALAQTGIDMEDVAAQLERDGVRAFLESHDTLHAALEAKRVGFER